MLLLPVLAASAVFADIPPVRAYEAELGRQCPAKHLEWLNPGIVVDPLDDFVSGLPPAQQRVVQQRAARDCAHVEAGASCGDVSAIRSLHALKLTARLAAHVCEAGWTCTAPLACYETSR